MQVAIFFRSIKVKKIEDKPVAKEPCCKPNLFYSRRTFENVTGAMPEGNGFFYREDWDGVQSCSMMRQPKQRPLRRTRATCT